MNIKKTPSLDMKALSKRYGFSVTKVINRWKANKKDYEIASELGIDLFKIVCLRKEIENHRFNRQKVISKIHMFDK